MDRLCKDCRWLGDCQREHGADPYDPACTGWMSAATDPAVRKVLADAGQNRALPKARLFYIRRRQTSIVSRGSRRLLWARFRLANAMFIWLGPVEIGWRMPWLVQSAQAVLADAMLKERQRNG